MPWRPRFGGTSLALRLCIIALVPTLSLAGMSYGQIGRERQAAAMNADIVAAVELQRDAAELIAPAVLERIALEGLAFVDRLGVDRDVVTTFIGLDFEVIYEENRSELDAALLDLGDNHPDLVLPDETLLSARVSDLTADVEEQRNASDLHRGDSAEIVETFEAIDEVISQVFTSAVLPTDTTVEGIEDLSELQAIVEVASTGGELTQTIARSLPYSPSDRRDQAVAAAASHISSRRAFAALLNDERLAMFEALEVPELPLELIADEDGPAGTIATDPAVILMIAAAIEDQITYLSQLHDYSVRLHDEITADAIDRAAAAESAVARTIVFVALTAALSLGLAGYVLVTTAGPLARLSRRAEAVSNGDWAGEPLRLAGPTSVRRLTSTVNDMLVTLTSVDEQIARISSGDPDAAADVALPGPIGVSIRRSVERLASMTEELAHRARHDLLTTLPNRYAAMEHLQALIDDDTAFALLFIDLDGFKAVNDTMGHDAGDEVLRAVAGRLSRSTRPHEFVSRLGGDEFLVIVSDFDTLDAVVALGERLIREVERPYGSHDEIFALSASVGVVTPEPGVPALEVLHQADSALHLAKRSGRGRVERFDHTTHTTLASARSASPPSDRPLASGRVH